MRIYLVRCIYLIESPESTWENQGDYYVTYRIRFYDNVGNPNRDHTATPPVAPERELINNHQWNFPFNIAAPVFSSPNFADLNGDGKPEIIIGSDNGKVYALTDTGANITGWPVQLGGAVQHKVAIDDVDINGDLEVIATCNDGNLYIFNHDGTNLSGFPEQLITSANIVTTSPAVFTNDINTGGGVETFVVCTFNNRVFGFFRDKFDTRLGRIGKWWEHGITSATIYTSPVIGDINSDGEVEVVVVSGSILHIWWFCGTPYKSWVLPAECRSTPALADIDEDGDLEIFIGCDNGKLYAYHHDGSVLANWEGGKQVGGAGSMIRSSPVIGEITNDTESDPILEVIAASTDGYISAFNTRSGNLLWRAHTKPIPGTIPIQYYPIYSSPCIGRIENNNDRMAVIVGDDSGKLYAFEGITGNALPRFYTEMGDTGEPARGAIKSSPGIINLDEDNDIEIVVGCNDGKVYVFDYDGNVSLKCEWQMFKSDLNSTGNYNYTEKYKMTAPTICIVEPKENIIVAAKDIYEIRINTYARWGGGEIKLWYCHPSYPTTGDASKIHYIGSLNTDAIEHHRYTYKWDLSRVTFEPNVYYLIYGKITYQGRTGEDYSRGGIDPPLVAGGATLTYANANDARLKIEISIPTNALSEGWGKVFPAEKTPEITKILKEAINSKQINYDLLMQEAAWNINLTNKNKKDLITKAPVTVTVYYPEELTQYLEKGEDFLRIFRLKKTPIIANNQAMSMASSDSATYYIKMEMVKDQTVDIKNNKITFRTTDLNAIYMPLEALNITAISLTAYPVPFNPLAESLTIEGNQLDGVEEIKIYNLAGEHIVTITKPASDIEATWDGKNKHRKTIANGVYFYVFKPQEGKAVARKIAVVKK